MGGELREQVGLAVTLIYRPYIPSLAVLHQMKYKAIEWEVHRGGGAKR